MKGRHRIVLILLLQTAMMEEFYVIVPDYPVVAMVGEDALLECQKVPDTSLDALEVRWFTTSPESPVHLYTSGQDRAEVQDEAYRGRTELFREEFPHGNASLKLKRVKVSDAGMYTCSISTPTSRQQEALRLQVEGEFYVIVPDYPVVAMVGEDALLECQKVPDTSLDALEVRWFTTSPESPVHLYTSGQDRAEVQDEAYRGRTELFREEFPHGNASLKLKRVKVSDAGMYTCSISTPTSRQQEALRLQVEEEFYVIVPDYPVVAMVGEDALLECQKVPDTSLDALEVRWFTTSPESMVHLYTNGQDRAEVQDEAYRGRTELFREEFPHGNASLKLKRVKVSDAGMYTCSISTPTSHQQEALRLQVEGFGLRPWIRLEESTTQGVRVVCKSDGWFPKPEIRWLDGSGQDVTERSDTLFTENPSGMFTVHSHIDVTSDSVNRYSCYIWSKMLGKTRETHLQISDELFPKTNPWLLVFWLFVALVVTAAAFNIMLHRKEDRMIKELQLFLSMEGYEDVERDCVSVTLDVETAHPELEVSEDRKRVRWTGTVRRLPDTWKRFTHWACVLGSEGFTSGRHYWEVEVAGSRDWRLGVAAESVERKRWITLSPETGVWSIELWDAFTSPLSCLPARPIPRRVGVYLSYESGTVSFYDADTKSILHTFTGNKF
ncbi:butyrophilin subfamily 1 member A1-like, partial [Amblyraja radiata]|uniref:butyrophilin subfamily 1 member A1-like n=1 Tax=Amblyraja radiata TaxID=386614 RepID=UPI0014031886